MAQAPGGGTAAKDLVQRRWKEHRGMLRAESFGLPGGGICFAIADLADRPASFHVFTAGGDSRVHALRGDLGDGATHRSAADIARAALAGEIPSRTVAADVALRLLGLTGDGTASLAGVSVERFAERLGDVRIAARLPREGLLASEAARFAAAGVAAIRSRLEPEALGVLSAAEGFSWRDYNFYAAPGAAGDIRRQAARHFPLFAGFIPGRYSACQAVDAQAAEMARAAEYAVSDAYRDKLASPQERGGVTRTVREWMELDGRDPFAPWQMAEKAVRQALQGAFGADAKGQPAVPMHVFSNLRGVSWPTGGVPVDRIVQALAELPPDWFPRTREDWDAFCDLTDTVGRTLGRLSGQTDAQGRVVPVPLRVLYEGCGGKWAALRERFVRAYADQRPPEGALEQDAAIIEAGIDWAALAALPRGKVGAAAVEAVARLEGLSAGCTQTEVAAWAVRRAAPDMGREALRNACLEVDDMLDAFSRKVLLPLAANEASRRGGFGDYPLAQQHLVVSRDAAARILLPGKSAVRLMETVRAYINRVGEILGAAEDPDTEEERLLRRAEESRKAAIGAEMRVVGIDPSQPIPPNGWAPLCTVARAPNGVYVVPLTDPAMLADEGRARNGPSLNADGSHGLRICVGESGQGYIGHCQRDGQHIVSFRVPGGADGVPYTRLSCLQVGPINEGSVDLKLLQHRGPGNGAVPVEALRALEWFRDAVLRGEVVLNYRGVRERIALARAAKVDEVALACGYDWRDRGRVGRAMAAWGPFVGKRHRRMGLDEFARDAEVAAVVQAIDPQMEEAPELAPGR